MPISTRRTAEGQGAGKAQEVGGASHGLPLTLGGFLRKLDSRHAHRIALYVEDAALPCAVGTQSPAMIEQLRGYLQDLATHGDIHGVLGVYADGEPLAQQAYGLADTASGCPNTPATRFRIGSLSKSYTAAAILALVQRRLLGLDDRASEYLPGCGLDPRITLRHLLLHRSGLGNHTALPGYWSELMQRRHEPEDLVRTITASPLLYTPGQASSYSNTGYVALARIAELACDRPLHDLLEASFWSPFGLERTGGPACADTVGYLLAAGRPQAPALDPSVSHGAYDLVATAQDLARWWSLLCNGRVLEPAYTTLMLGGGPGEFGCGWWLDELDIGGRHWRTVAHRGDVNGHTSMLLGIPVQRLCAVALFNTASTPASATARRLLGLALGEQWPAYPPALPSTARWPGGAYRGEDGSTCHVDAAGQAMHAVRDYGVPCQYAIRPYAVAEEVQAWRSDAFDERLTFNRHDGSMTVEAPDGARRRYWRDRSTP